MFGKQLWTQDIDDDDRKTGWRSHVGEGERHNRQERGAAPDETNFREPKLGAKFEGRGGEETYESPPGLYVCKN